MMAMLLALLFVDVVQSCTEKGLEIERVGSSYDTMGALNSGG
jgi:hypothetical protein